jgi:uncharacterized BrkB/YihY/UPF0761 family membrane protein
MKSGAVHYGNFATVITMLSWFYLQSVVTLLGAQLNVVLKERLHPRRLVTAPVTDSRSPSLRRLHKERTYHHDQQVHTEFQHPDHDEK